MFAFTLPVLITGLMAAAQPTLPTETWAVKQAHDTAQYQVEQFKDLETFRIASDFVSAPVVMYDIEGWEASGKWQVNHPYRAMRNFVRLAHARGFQTMLAPSPRWAVRAAAIPTDYFLVQSQGKQCRPDRFKEFVSEVRARATGYVIAETSVIRSRPCDTVENIRASIASVAGIADGISVWGWPDHMDKLQAVLA